MSRGIHVEKILKNIPQIIKNDFFWMLVKRLVIVKIYVIERFVQL